jgi:hypothetical protein
VPEKLGKKNPGRHSESQSWCPSLSLRKKLRGDFVNVIGGVKGTFSEIKHFRGRT